MASSWWAPSADPLPPVADSRGTPLQGFGDLAVGPALLLEASSLEAPGFFPALGCWLQAS